MESGDIRQRLARSSNQSYRRFEITHATANFALGVRTVRLLVDKAVLGEGNHFAS